MRKVFKVSEAKLSPVPPPRTGSVKWLINRDTVGVKDLPAGLAVLIYQPGEKTDLHSNPSTTEILFVLRGQARITIDGESYEVESDTAVYLPSGSTHSIQNIGDDELQYLFVSCPAAGSR